MKNIYKLILLLFLLSGCSEHEWDTYERLLLGVSKGIPISTAKEYDKNESIHKIALIEIDENGNTSGLNYPYFPHDWDWAVGTKNIQEAELIGIVYSSNARSYRCSYTGNKSITIKIKKIKVKIYKAKSAELLAEKSFPLAKERPACPSKTRQSRTRVIEDKESLKNYLKKHIFDPGFLKLKEEEVKTPVAKEPKDDKESLFGQIIVGIIALAIALFWISDP